jgi:hypothetical protein
LPNELKCIKAEYSTEETSTADCQAGQNTADNCVPAQIHHPKHVRKKRKDGGYYVSAVFHEPPLVFDATGLSITIQNDVTISLNSSAKVGVTVYSDGSVTAVVGGKTYSFSPTVTGEISDLFSAYSGGSGNGASCSGGSCSITESATAEIGNDQVVLDSTATLAPQADDPPDGYNITEGEEQALVVAAGLVVVVVAAAGAWGGVGDFVFGIIAFA